MITAATLPHSALTTSQQHASMLAGAAAASTPSTGTAPSSVCSTPLTMFNPSFQPLVQYVHQPSYQYAQPAISPATPIVPPLTNLFEGIPIFLIPQNGVGPATVPLAAIQRAAELKANWTTQNQTPKIDTSKHFHVFVGDLATEVDNNALKAAFAAYGEISEAKVIRDPQTMKSKGYGFVSFPSKESAEKAIAGMNGQLVGRRQIRTNWASRKPTTADESHPKEQSFEEVFNATRADNTSVYVGNVHSSTTEDDLREAFASIGTISEVRIFKQQGYAFVRYATKEAATRAIMRMNGKEINGQNIRCSWGRTPNDNCLMANQAALNGLSLVGANFLGMNQIANPLAWSQNQCLSQFYGHPAAIQSWQA
ncbi:Nucleolysin TIAR [Toxocara canis]|uniref:Nucleolysin TIAR n=1 Tax=Toxocara canis TaxID=6265 RepID=A0A0B2VE67_TOXCA|nr:Nucleolysin TIAR [Toxocara canis]